jgi:hypothetical protein
MAVFQMDEGPKEGRMRVTRRIAAMLGGAIVATVLWTPTAAHADGGAYIELNHTYYLTGDTAVAEAYVSIPKADQAILDRGPFFLYLLRRNMYPGAKPGIPDGSIRLGTVDVEQNGREIFELKLRFTVPQTPSGVHYLAVCNDPCTVAGFKEPLTGSMNISATAREITLQQGMADLRSKMWRVQNDLRSSDKKLDDVIAQLQAALRGNTDKAADVVELRDRLDAADATIASESTRPLIDPWAAVLAAASLLVLAGALVVRRRRGRSGRPQAAEPVIS